MYNALLQEAKLRESHVFKVIEIDQLCRRLQVTMEIAALVEIMRNECYLLLKGPNTYQVNVVGL